MKKILCAAMLVIAYCVHLEAQGSTETPGQTDMKNKRTKYGVKAGYNFSTVTGSTPNFDPRHSNGFMISAFMAPPSHAGFGFRSEIVFSRQGFSYDASGKRQDITQDYIYLPQLTTFNIGNWLQLQAGMQIGYLLTVKKDNTSTGEQSRILDMYNRFDYGFAGGVELNPVKGLIVGARYNASFGNLYKQEFTGGGVPSPLPFNPSDLNSKNAVIQFFAGYKF